MDRLSDTYHLIYYDQRGRGNSTGEPHDVPMASEVDDLEALRNHLQLDTVALLGHSWGNILALQYALRHRSRVSHLLLMNSAPASYDDFMRFRQERRRTTAEDMKG